MITSVRAGDRLRVICRSEDCEYSDDDGYGEAYDDALIMQGDTGWLEAYEDSDGHDVQIAGLNYFLLEQLEHWVEPNVNHVKVNLSTYKDDSNLTVEDKKVIEDYVKINNLIELV